MKVERDLRESMLNEMARVGIIGGYEIYVHTDDPGKIPHFHIWDYSTKGEKFHTCIKIEVAEYFNHNGKEDKLNHKLKKELVDFLEKPYNTYLTNWQLLLIMWNINNSDVKVDEDQEMPDYMTL